MGRRTYSEEEKAAVIYGLRCVGVEQYFYVGTTRYGAADRFRTHMYQAETGRHVNKHLGNRLRKLGRARVLCDVLETVAADEQWIREAAWIEQLLAQGHPLLNRIHNEFNYLVTDYRSYTLPYARYAQARAILAKSASLKAKRPEWQPLVNTLCTLLQGTIDSMDRLGLAPSEECPQSVRF